MATFPFISRVVGKVYCFYSSGRWFTLVFFLKKHCLLILYSSCDGIVITIHREFTLFFFWFRKSRELSCQRSGRPADV
jgi:hypothetical protein